MSDELINVRLEHGEAIQAKKNLLSIEMELLTILKNIKRYQILRKEELKFKAKLKRKAGGTLTSVKKMQAILPKVKIPKKIKRHEIEIGGLIEKPKFEHDDKLESELRKIQERLMRLQK